MGAVAWNEDLIPHGGGAVSTTEAKEQKCSCQYGNSWDRVLPRTPNDAFTPNWYISVKTCPLHSHYYDPGCTPSGWDVARNEPKSNPVREAVS